MTVGHAADPARLHDRRSRADRHGRDAAERRRDRRRLDRGGRHARARGEEVPARSLLMGRPGGAQARAHRRGSGRASATTPSATSATAQDYMPRQLARAPGREHDVDAARARHARLSAGRRPPPRVRRRRRPRASTSATGSSRSRRRPSRTSRRCSASTARKATSSIFKILKRGEHEASGEADLALRYDLTVPLARVVARVPGELPKFFKRYQIQPVWRADRPARGRFREFYQCDIDAIGSTSPVVEAEHARRRQRRC